MNAVHQAEQATLGCLMLEPTLAGDVLVVASRR